MKSNLYPVLKHQYFVYANLVFLALAATGCGGGGGNGDSNPQPLAAGFSHFSGTVFDSTGVPLVDAEVKAPFGSNEAWGARTDSKGNYSFDAKATDYSNVSPVAVVVSKEGYRSRTLYYTSVNEGSEYTFKSDTNTSPAKLADNEYVPVNTPGLWHIGDDGFEGAANSQLQVKSQGNGVVFLIGDWTTSKKDKFNVAEVEFFARGIQTSICPGGYFGLSAGAAAAYTPVSDSDSNGNFTKYRFTVDISAFAINTNVVFVAKSGECASDIDDLEFTEVFVSFR